MLLGCNGSVEDNWEVSIHYLPSPTQVETELRLATIDACFDANRSSSLELKEMAAPRNISRLEERGLEERGRESTMYNKLVECSLNCWRKAMLRKSFVQSLTSPFVSLGLEVGENTLLYTPPGTWQPSMLYLHVKARGQLVCKLANASDTCGVS